MEKGTALKRRNTIAWCNHEPVMINCNTTSYWNVFMEKGTVLRVVGNHIATHGGYVLVTDGESKYLILATDISHIVGSP